MICDLKKVTVSCKATHLFSSHHKLQYTDFDVICPNQPLEVRFLHLPFPVICYSCHNMLGSFAILYTVYLISNGTKDHIQ